MSVRLGGYSARADIERMAQQLDALSGNSMRSDLYVLSQIIRKFSDKLTDKERPQLLKSYLGAYSGLNLDDIPAWVQDTIRAIKGTDLGQANRYIMT